VRHNHENRPLSRSSEADDNALDPPTDEPATESSALPNPEMGRRGYLGLLGGGVGAALLGSDSVSAESAGYGAGEYGLGEYGGTESESTTHRLSRLRNPTTTQMKTVYRMYSLSRPTPSHQPQRFRDLSGRLATPTRRVRTSSTERSTPRSGPKLMRRHSRRGAHSHEPLPISNPRQPTSTERSLRSATTPASARHRRSRRWLPISRHPRSTNSPLRM